MIITIRQDASWEQITPLLQYCQGAQVDVRETYGYSYRILSLIGDTHKLDMDRLYAFEFVMDVKRLQPPYRLAGREQHAANSSFNIKNAAIGDGQFLFIAGPCSVESEQQIFTVANEVKAAGATMLRGGAFKPRSSPYAFQGLQEEGIRLLVQAGKAAGLPVVTEIMEVAQLPLFEDIDVIQVGTRNMQNYELLKELGKLHKPILLKRGLSARIEEILMSAEYIMAGGNERVILCERGIRTFETQVRYTLDISAVPLIKELSHLPIIVDPSHGTGRRKLVPPMALAAAVAGADGLMIEVHNDPENALCDGNQAITPAAFGTLVRRVESVRAALI